jgi:transcriptional regulator with XRE-family HTH domain
MSQGEVSAYVGGRIHAARKMRGVTAQALADAITGRGYAAHRATIAKIENGIQEKVPVDVVVHAARVLQVPVLSLLSDGPWCSACGDDPPVGFACRSCGAEA